MTKTQITLFSAAEIRAAKEIFGKIQRVQAEIDRLEGQGEASQKRTQEACELAYAHLRDVIERQQEAMAEVMKTQISAAVAVAVAEKVHAQLFREAQKAQEIAFKLQSRLSEIKGYESELLSLMPHGLTRYVLTENAQGWHDNTDPGASQDSFGCIGHAIIQGDNHFYIFAEKDDHCLLLETGEASNSSYGGTANCKGFIIVVPKNHVVKAD